MPSQHCIVLQDDLGPGCGLEILMVTVRRPFAKGITLQLLLWGLTVVSFIATSAWDSVAEERTVTVMGHGSESCRTWIESRKEGYSVGYGDWLLGYLSGVNDWGPTGKRDLLHKQSGQELIEWIDNYCRHFPDDEIQAAARQLTLDLGRRAKESGAPSSHP
jgi:hypothetical protein